MLQWSWSNRTLALDPAQPVRKSAIRAPETLQALSSLWIQLIADPARLVFPVLHGVEARGELPRADLRHLLPRGASHGRVGGDQADPLPIPMLGGKALEQRIGIACEPHLEGTEARVRPDPVEDHDAARTADGDEARERIDQLFTFIQARGAQNVVAVEEVQGGIRHCGASELRRRAAQRRR